MGLAATPARSAAAEAAPAYAGTCERAARQALAPRNPQGALIAFNGAPSLDAAMSSASQQVLRGTGRWKGADGERAFAYTCNVDVKSGESVGLVLREAAPPDVAAPAIDPDLSHLSPAACESRAAAELKARWPRVSQISFDTGTRSLRQDSASSAELTGRGRALPAPGDPAAHFGFGCEIDPRDGRVLAARVWG